MNYRNKLKNKKGITLIALIIIVVILVIITAITIRTFDEEDGIISRTKKAAQNSKVATETEKINLKWLDLNTEYLMNHLNDENMTKKDFFTKEKLEEDLGVDITYYYYGGDSESSFLKYKDKSNIEYTFEITLDNKINALKKLPYDKWDGTVAISFYSGDGSENSPYIIMKAEHLAYFAYEMNTNKNTFKDKFIRIDNSIDLDNIDWNPIGKQVSFLGTLDGNNKAISNLHITSSVDGTGLFGSVGSNGIIKNLKIENATIKGSGKVGGFVGNLYGGTIENCEFDGNIDGSYCGGIVGCCSNGLVKKCISRGNIGSYNEWRERIGGIIGAQWNGTAYIEDCKNYANIYGHQRVGGIFGCPTYNNMITINNCENYGTVTGQADLGGIMGQAHHGAYTTIKNCINNGNLVGVNVWGCLGYNVGGIVGRTNETPQVIENCINNGIVSSCIENVGGIIGCPSNNIQITNCVANGKFIKNESAIMTSINQINGVKNDTLIITNCTENMIIEEE